MCLWWRWCLYEGVQSTPWTSVCERKVDTARFRCVAVDPLKASFVVCRHSTVLCVQQQCYSFFQGREVFHLPDNIGDCHRGGETENQTVFFFRVIIRGNASDVTNMFRRIVEF